MQRLEPIITPGLTVRVQTLEGIVYPLVEQVETLKRDVQELSTNRNASQYSAVTPPSPPQDSASLFMTSFFQSDDFGFNFAGWFYGRRSHRS